MSHKELSPERLREERSDITYKFILRNTKYDWLRSKLEKRIIGIYP